MFLLRNIKLNVNKEVAKEVYFGGEILNPKSEYVLLMQQDKILDTLELNDKNFFGKYLPNLKPGLFAFKHGNEFQYLYLEPSDSILIRLNTWDFDESLVFDGKGAEKSDFLLELFLNNEREMSNFSGYFKLPVEEFDQKFSIYLDRNLKIFKDFAEAHPHLSTDYLNLIKGASTYPLYRMKEIYPFLHRIKSQEDSIDLPSDFYQYRKNVNLNDSLLEDYYAYQNYLSAYIYNDAFTKSNFTKTLDDDFRLLVLESIIEHIHIEPLKNSLLYQEISQLILNNDTTVNPVALELFYDNCTDTKMISNVKETLQLKQTLKDYNLIKHLKFKDRNRNIKSLDQIINKRPTLLMFWYDDELSKESLNKRLNYLTKKYPDIQLIEILYDSGQTIVYYQNSTSYDNRLINTDDVKNYVSEHFPRSLIINKKGEIANNFSLIFNHKIEKELINVLQ